MRETLKIILEHWKRIARRIGDFQARLILSVFYYVIFAPFGLGVRVFSDPLDIKNTQTRKWLTRTEEGEQSSTYARRQY